MAVAERTGSSFNHITAVALHAARRAIFFAFHVDTHANLIAERKFRRYIYGKRLRSIRFGAERDADFAHIAVRIVFVTLIS